MRFLGGVLVFLCSYFAYSKTPCSALLSRRLSSVINEQRQSKAADFSHFIDRNFAKKLEDYYSRAPLEEVYARARETLSHLLADSENLIEASLRSSYLFALQHYMDRGGRFVIDLEMNDFTVQTDIVAKRNPAYEFIRVPLYLLLYIELGVPQTKENLLRDLSHELRHSITDQRTRRKLRRSGVTEEPDFIYAHIGTQDVNQSIGYAYMLENEAIVAQNRFVPQASRNTGDVNLYPELQSLQRLLHTFTYKDLAELESDIAANRQFSILSSSYVDHYIQHLEQSATKEDLPPRVAALLAKLGEEPLNIERAILLALEDYDVYAKCIEGRLDKELSTFLKEKIEKLFRKRALRLRRAYMEIAETRS